MSVTAVEPHHVRAYFDKVKNTRSLSVARSDITALRGIFSKAMDWGALRSHPMNDMRFEQLPAATDEVEDWQIDAMLSIPPNTRTVRLAQLYVRLKLILGLRRGDLLRLKLSDIREDGIHCELSKTRKSSGVRCTFLWVDDEGQPVEELRSVIDEILSIPPRRIGDAFLFTTRQGKGFMNEETGRANGFDTLWQRYMDKVMAQTKIDHRIKEKTLRAYVAITSKSDEDARERLGHTTVATTRKHYLNRKNRQIPALRREQQH